MPIPERFMITIFSLYRNNRAPQFQMQPYINTPANTSCLGLFWPVYISLRELSSGRATPSAIRSDGQLPSRHRELPAAGEPGFVLIIWSPMQSDSDLPQGVME